MNTLPHLRKRPGSDACWIASCSMVEGLTQDEFDTLQWQFIELKDCHGAEGAIERMCGLFPWALPGLHGFITTTRTFGTPGAPDILEHKPRLYGRGVLLINFPGRGHGHAVAFCDGTIYDPDEAFPMEYGRWAARTSSPWRPTELINLTRVSTRKWRPYVASFVSGRE